MDDILVASDTFEGHLKDLKVTLQTLRENNLSANPTKCDFSNDHLEYLGYRISADGIQVSRQKMAIIEAIQPPQSVKSLQRLLGMCNYWKKTH